VSCPHLDTHLLPELDRETQTFLSIHAQTCPECQHRLAVRRRAYAVLASDVPPLTPRAQAAQWAELEAATQTPAAPSWIGWAVGLGLATAAGALVLGLFLPSPPEPSPTVEMARAPSESGAVHLLPGQRLEFGDLSARAKVQVDLQFPEGPTGRRVVILAGEVELDVLSAPPGWWVETPHGAFQLVAARVGLNVEATRTRARVQRGQVELDPSRPGIQWDIPPSTPPTAAPNFGARPLPPSPGPAQPAAPLRTPPPRADRQVLEEARSLIGHDDERAVQIAEAVIARRPDGPTEVAALMIAADGWRRRGGRDEAADYYRQAAEHPMGQAFAEEATLRRATLLTELGQDRRALELLEQAQLRFGAQGNLSPERSAATARLQLAQGRPADAALTLSRETGADRVLEEPRVLVAEALLERDPSTARALVERVVSGTLAERAARIRAHTKNNRGLK
jgi:hypothetical protein